MQPLQPLVLQPDLWCSQVFKKQGFLTLQVLQVLSRAATGGSGWENWDDANTVCLCCLDGQSLCTPFAPHAVCPFAGARRSSTAAPVVVKV